MQINFFQDMKAMGSEMRAFIKELPKLAGAEMLDSIDQNFRTESFFGTPWAPRVVQKGNEGRSILVQSGRLRRSFQLKNSGLTIRIFTDVPYAEIHNEGGVISGSVQVEAYERHQYGVVAPPKKKDGSADKRFSQKKQKTGTIQVQAHARNQNTTIPARPFMGDHPQLDAKIENLIENGLRSILDA